MIEIESKDIEKSDWDRFVLEHSGSFLQSAEWGEFQKSIGREVYFLKDDGWQALIIKHSLPLGKSYLYCPRGPVILTPPWRGKDLSRMRDFIDITKELAQQKNAIFLRIEPTFEISGEELKETGFIKTKDVQPSRTLILDLDKSEEELLAQMHEKTRYNIGLAQRKGVTVRKTEYTEYNEKDFEEFWRLIGLTYKKQGIRNFPEEYYRKELQINPPQPSPYQVRGKLFKKEGDSSLYKREVGRDFVNLLFLAEYQGKIIAVNLVNIFGGTATYLHGGSDNEYRALMAPHLLQWEQIKYAKNQSCRIYDFWGYDEERWPGVSRFKKGFGGREITFCGTHDYIFDKFWYRIYKAARSILR